MEKINSQTSTWETASNTIDIGNLEKFLLSFDPKDSVKTFYHAMYDIIVSYAQKWAKVIEAGWQFWWNLFILPDSFSKTLLDLDASAIQRAKKLYQDNNKQAKFIVWDMFAMPIQDGEYDIIFNSWVLEHFTQEERTKALKEYARILSKDGLMVLAIPNHMSFWYRFYYLFLNFVGQWKIPAEYKIPNFDKEIEQNNLRLIDTKIICPEVIFDNYNNIFWIGTLWSAFSQLIGKRMNPIKVASLNKRFWFWNLLRIIHSVFPIQWYLLVFVIGKK